MSEPLEGAARIDRLWPDPAADLDDAAILAGYDPGPAPWLRLNFVSSVDGAVTVDGRSGGLGDAADRRVFDLLRTQADVVLVGAGTLRDEGYTPIGMPLAAVSRSGDAPAADRVFPSPEAALAGLAGLRIHCEGGPRLAGALAAAGAVDELCVTVAARLVGGDGPRMLGGISADSALRLAQVLRGGDTLLLRYRRAAS